MSDQLAKIEPKARPVSNAITPMEMLQIAVEKGADLDQLTKLMDLQERWEKTEARKAYTGAINAFKADPPTIFKNKTVGFGKTEYDHATLDQVSAVIGAALAEHGLSHTWKVNQAENAMIRVTCVITHVLGHSEETGLEAMPDNSGSKNAIQAVGSTVSYLERYTLLAATGLATVEQDDDGDTGGNAPIDAAQKETIIELLRVTQAKTQAFCRFFSVGSVDEIPAHRFDEAVGMLEKKKQAAVK